MVVTLPGGNGQNVQPRVEMESKELQGAVQIPSHKTEVLLALEVL